MDPETKPKLTEEDKACISLLEKASHLIECKVESYVCMALEKAYFRLTWREAKDETLITFNRAIWRLRDHIGRSIHPHVYYREWLTWETGRVIDANEARLARLAWIDHMIKLLRYEI